MCLLTSERQCAHFYRLLFINLSSLAKQRTETRAKKSISLAWLTRYRFTVSF